MKKRPCGQTVAKKKGPTPNVVEESARRPRFELVNRACRAQGSRPAKSSRILQLTPRWLTRSKSFGAKQGLVLLS